jgi:hypothetical protein
MSLHEVFSQEQAESFHTKECFCSGPQMDEQQGQRPRQYWFITEYIALYIQTRLFTVQETRCTRRTKYVVRWSRSGSRGVGSSPQLAGG